VVIYRWNAPTDGQDLVVHLFRNGIPVCDPWYLDRSHIPVTQADKGNPRQDIVIDGSPGRSVGFLEVIITLAGADPIPMISTPVLFLQSNHIAYFRYYYRPACSSHFFVESLSTGLQNINLAFSSDNLYKKGIAHAADLLEQDKLGGSAPLTRKGSAPPRSSIKYPIRDPGQPSEVEPWSNGRTPVLNHQGYWARTPTVTAGFLGSIFMVTCFRQGYHFIVQAINDDRNFH